MYLVASRDSSEILFDGLGPGGPGPPEDGSPRADRVGYPAARDFVSGWSSLVFVSGIVCDHFRISICA